MEKLQAIDVNQIHIFSLHMTGLEYLYDLIAAHLTHMLKQRLLEITLPGVHAFLATIEKHLVLLPLVVSLSTKPALVPVVNIMQRYLTLAQFAESIRSFGSVTVIVNVFDTERACCRSARVIVGVT